MDRKRQPPFKLIVYLGETRPFSDEDYGAQLLLELEKNKYVIAALLLRESDPINQYPVFGGLRRFFLPEALTLPKPQMEALLAKEGTVCGLDAWLEEIRTLGADLGIVFYGHWIPPKLFTLPRLGFINYHPGPLPFLRGMEPDTFTILEGWRRVWGAVNRVEECFDSGDILARTKMLRVSRHATPADVLHTLTAYGVDAIIRAAKIILKNNQYRGKRVQGEGSLATIAMARRASRIQWDSDTCEVLRRKLRAFCGQDIGIRLKAHIEDKLYFVFDLEVWRTRKKRLRPYAPGAFLGRYLYPGKFLDMPIIKTADGAAVLLAEEARARADEAVPFPKEALLAPVKRPRAATRGKIEKSILAWERQKED